MKGKLKSQPSYLKRELYLFIKFAHRLDRLLNIYNKTQLPHFYKEARLSN